MYLPAAFSSCEILSMLLPLAERLTTLAVVVVWRAAVVVTRHSSRILVADRFPGVASAAHSVSPWKASPTTEAAAAAEAE